ncbi:23S rRNA (adenine(2503)-C(2))-methyltransferase RlmN [Desulfatitalea tepidiphila]|uniref:23S rRNA (adenine(2503)-C(2))-methyltransferase RlmN n=1 Tax=Desulfatitalea tepidiphila TaxID=1185843 RepID=UPI000975617E|nr:23S rRNA (adenine(2503)-C(2))-methyltransferase RlmN [Desulfatitalea tepidiphila]
MNPLSLTYDQLVEQLQRRYGRGPFHAGALYRAFYNRPALDLREVPEFSGSPELARHIGQDLKVHLPKVSGRIQEEGVTKLQFRLADGLVVETVLIPMVQHTTVCVSCQVGCRMGCRFCQTGQMGLLRPLSVDEIVAQVFMVKIHMGLDVRNVVFMGMGEPLDNFDAVIQAIAVLSDQRGLNIAKRYITLSTVGWVPGIERLAALNWPQLKLAVSLNAADDALRSNLMPVNRRYGLGTLRAVLEGFPLARGNVLLVEYVLIRDVNDRPEDARRLARFVSGLPVRVNLIVYNPREASPFEAPWPEEVERFRRALVDLGVFVRLRGPKGAGIRAACGQLGGVSGGPVGS